MPIGETPSPTIVSNRHGNPSNVVDTAAVVRNAVEYGHDNEDNLCMKTCFPKTLLPTNGIRPISRHSTLMVVVFAAWWALFSPIPSLAQDERQDAKQIAANIPAEIEQGIWPSLKLMEIMLARWAEEAAYEYDLDDQQREETRKAVVSRWTKFLEENREKIQPLANEFLEMRLALTPPTKESVQDWARRARPVFDKTLKQLESGTSEYRKILRPDQRVKFEIDAVQLKLGLGFAQQKFSAWEKGEFEADDFWQPIGPERTARREERRKRRKEREAREEERQSQGDTADKRPADTIEAEMDAWQRYVADFISTYGLDLGQRDTVLSCLTELRDRAIAHRDRYREEIARLEERIASNTGAGLELAEIKEQLNRLYGPIDDMFKELQTRLEQVPTADQKASAKSKPTTPPSSPGEPRESAATPPSGE